MRPRDLSVYIHLPFCARKCHYCDFNSRPGSNSERARYLDALKAEIDRRGEILGGRRVRTVFFGGGTPTVYDGSALTDVLARVSRESGTGKRETGKANDRASGTASFVVCRTGFQPVSRPVEITCEANPESVDLHKLRVMREAGFNRISIGAQSFHDDELEMLGRGHTAGQTEQAVTAAREAGFENVSLDLIYALPGQTVERWRETLLRALALHPEHLSAYGLELAEGTPLFDRRQRGEIEPIPDDQHLAMRQITLELCERAGLERYEISSYALPGYECAHNITYWHNDPYIGFGAGAWSYLDGVRSENLREPMEYADAIEAGELPASYEERLDPDDALAETLMMGLRMTEGLQMAALRERFGGERIRDMLARAEPLEAMGLVDCSDGHIRLTAEGQPLHSEVCVRLA